MCCHGHLHEACCICFLYIIGVLWGWNAINYQDEPKELYKPLAHKSVVHLLTFQDMLQQQRPKESTKPHKYRRENAPLQDKEGKQVNYSLMQMPMVDKSRSQTVQDWMFTRVHKEAT